MSILETVEEQLKAIEFNYRAEQENGANEKEKIANANLVHRFITADVSVLIEEHKKLKSIIAAFYEIYLK